MRTWIVKELFQFFSSLCQRGRERDLHVVQTSRDRQNLHKIPERKAELAVRREKLAKQR